MKKLIKLVVLILTFIFITCSTQSLKDEDSLYWLSIHINKGGSMVDNSTSTISGFYRNGEQIRLPLVGSFPDYEFAGWVTSDGGCFNDINANTYFIMPSNSTAVAATFKKLEQTPEEEDTLYYLTHLTQR